MAKHISLADKRLLEDLERKYPQDELIAIVTQMTNASNLSTLNNTEIQEEGESVNYQELILDFIQKLEGYRVRLREFHWSAEKMAAHKLTDDLMNTLITVEDDIAEDLQGFLGIRIKVGTLVPILPTATDIKSLLQVIIQETLTLRASIDGIPELVGIVSMLDDLIHSMNKSLYLETFG